MAQMISNDSKRKTFGLPSSSQDRELTYVYYKDGAVFTPGQQITTTQLFSSNNTTSKPSWLRNATFPTTTGRKVTITHIGAHMHLQLAPTTSISAGATTISQISLLDTFTSLSQLEFDVESKTYSPLPLYDLLDVRSASVYNSNSIYNDRQTRYLPLVDPILVPENGNFNITFRPADGYTALNDNFGSGSNLAYLPNVGTTFTDTSAESISNAGWYIQFVLFGTVSRPVK
jgi:hypothetical protein